MIGFVFIFAVLCCKAVLAVTFASEVNRRFARLPNTAEWWIAWVCNPGQIFAALVLTILQIPATIPATWRAVGAALFVAGHSLHLAAMIVNPHFRPEIVLPPELCRHRLYRLRHPGYIGLWLASLGATLLLGYSILAPCFSVYTGLLLSRIIKEERLLCRSTQEN